MSGSRDMSSNSNPLKDDGLNKESTKLVMVIFEPVTDQASSPKATPLPGAVKIPSSSYTVDVSGNQ
jgi:hypothetical protein